MTLAHTIVSIVSRDVALSSNLIHNEIGINKFKFCRVLSWITNDPSIQHPHSNRIYVDGIVQERRNSSAMELYLSYINPSMCKYTRSSMVQINGLPPVRCQYLNQSRFIVNGALRNKRMWIEIQQFSLEKYSKYIIRKMRSILSGLRCLKQYSKTRTSCRFGNVKDLA